MLDNMVAIITGSSRGIGKAIAREFVKNSSKVCINGIGDTQALRRLSDEMLGEGAHIEAVLGDVRKREDCEELFRSTMQSYGKVDILVNCAGVIARADFLAMTDSDWHAVLDTNLNGAKNMIETVLPSMIKQRSGSIINITSQMAHMVHSGANPSYEVSKAGLTALTKHLAFQYANHGIRINALAPGSIDTELPRSMSAEKRREIESKIPMGRLGDVSEVASAALFLASSSSSYITGTTLHVNGGSFM